MSSLKELQFGQLRLFHSWCMRPVQAHHHSMLSRNKCQFLWLFSGLPLNWLNKNNKCICLSLLFYTYHRYSIWWTTILLQFVTLSNILVHPARPRFKDSSSCGASLQCRTILTLCMSTWYSKVLNHTCQLTLQREVCQRTRSHDGMLKLTASL